MQNYYAIIYLGPLLGGFAKRISMLADSLATKAKTERIHSFSKLWRFLRSSRARDNNTSVIIYSDLMVPLVALLKIINRNMTVYYMVRGDQVTWARHAKRSVRAWTARVFQKLMIILGCRFVFASKDLRQKFIRRFGEINWARVLPNTKGGPLPDIRAFDGRLAVVGDFESVKNIEYVLENLDGSGFNVSLYGNSKLPEMWKRPWLNACGVVDDLKSHLQNNSLVVLASISEGFPNVLIDALEAGCGIVAHKKFPFEHLPLSDDWRFELNAPPDHTDSHLPSVLKNLRYSKEDFKSKNKALIDLIGSDWSARVFDIFCDCKRVA